MSVIEVMGRDAANIRPATQERLVPMQAQFTLCSFPECPKQARSRGWCKTHWRRWWIHGDPSVVIAHKDRGHAMRPLQERFWEKVDKGAGPEACWPWLGARTRGYGHITQRFKAIQVHRLSYEWAKGPIPDGLQIDHLCFNGTCVNPDHLEAVTARVNTQRRSARVTHCPRGHEYDANNTYLYRGSRHCRTCQRDRDAGRI